MRRQQQPHDRRALCDRHNPQPVPHSMLCTTSCTWEVSISNLPATRTTPLHPYRRHTAGPASAAASPPQTRQQRCPAPNTNICADGSVITVKAAPHHLLHSVYLPKQHAACHAAARTPTSTLIAPQLQVCPAAAMRLQARLCRFQSADWQAALQ